MFVKADKPVREKQAPEKKKMSFKEKKEFEELEKAISLLEKEKKILEEEFNSGTLAPDDLHKKSLRHGAITTELEDKEMRWLELGELA